MKNIKNQKTCLILSMPTNSISTAIYVLIEKDYVEKDKEAYYDVINPLLFAILKGAED